jgi:excisionase family DNA binding protein
MEPNYSENPETMLAANVSQRPTRRKPATMSIDEIARTLKIGRLKAYRLLEAGVIPGVRLGSRTRWLVSRCAFTKWLESAGSKVA